MTNLNKLTVLVTRPKPQGEILCEKIRAAGGQAIYFPTIEIKPPKDPIKLKHQITNIDQYDWLIFISPQAVYNSAEMIHALWPTLPAELSIAAVGLGTATVLQSVKLPVTIYPSGWSSEGLLRLPIFQQVENKRIAIMQGEGGRELLADTLIARGADVTHFIAYQRCKPTNVDMGEYIDLLRTQKINVIVLTSAEGLYNLISLTGEANKFLLQSVPVIVISERLAALASELQFSKILRAENASHEAILCVLEKGKTYDG